jgi:hypothetical protein
MVVVVVGKLKVWLVIFWAFERLNRNYLKLIDLHL